MGVELSVPEMPGALQHTALKGQDEVTTIPNSLGVCDEWWLFRPQSLVPSRYN
jgi:hypothetical protein